MSVLILASHPPILGWAGMRLLSVLVLTKGGQGCAGGAVPELPGALFLTRGEPAGPWKGFSIQHGSLHPQWILSAHAEPSNPGFRGRSCTSSSQAGAQPRFTLCSPHQRTTLPPPSPSHPPSACASCFIHEVIPSAGTAGAQHHLSAGGFSCWALSSTVPLTCEATPWCQWGVRGGRGPMEHILQPPKRQGHTGTSQRQSGSPWSSTRTSGLQQGQSVWELISVWQFRISLWKLRPAKTCKSQGTPWSLFYYYTI